VAFPSVVDSTNSDNGTTNATNHTVALPDGCDVAGRRVVMGFSCDGTPTITWPLGWNVLAQGNGAAGNNRMETAYLDLDGTEGFPATGATITVTTSASEGSAHAGYLLEDGTFDPAIAPEVLNADGASTNVNVDPPNLTPSSGGGGAKDYLWIAFGGWDASTALNSYPANYINTVTDVAAYAGGAGIAAGTRALNAASEDPAAFVLAAVEQRCAQTIAIHPASGGGGSTQPPRTMHQHRMRRAS
jgi:hypothetical protein